MATKKPKATTPADPAPARKKRPREGITIPLPADVVTEIRTVSRKLGVPIQNLRALCAARAVEAISGRVARLYADEVQKMIGDDTVDIDDVTLPSTTDPDADVQAEGVALA